MQTDHDNRKLSDYEKGYLSGQWYMFCLITSVEYGKQRFFEESNGLIYDRAHHDYLRSYDEAYDRYLDEIEGL